MIAFSNSGRLLASVALAAMLPGTALAQAKPAESRVEEEIVVVGTSLRSVQPAGAQTINIGAKAIEGTGAMSTDQLLATVPQISSFGSLQTVNAGGTQLTVNRINLRNLPQGIGGSSPTLILLDGHRMVGAGVKQSYPDPDVIPPALIQRVDVLTDGGSAVYGSDAVGGVVNFVTRRDYNGIEVGMRGGLADSYKSIDANFTAGKAWSTGSVYVAYNYAMHDRLLGSDRDYIKNIDWTTGLPGGKACSPANVTVGSSVYAVSNGNSLALSNANLCDISDYQSLYPKEVRHSVMAGFRQELSETLEFEVKGWYSNRKNTGYGLLQPSATVTSTNPLYIPTSPGNTASQSVAFNFLPVGGNSVVSTNLWSYGITPTLTWKIGGDWQAKAMFNYGQSKTTANDPSFDAAALAAGVTAGTINPYNIKASNATALAGVLNSVNYGIGKSAMSNGKVTVDGPLFTLPGGQVRAALGAEYLHEKYAGTSLQSTAQNVLAAPLQAASRNVKSLFGELNVPLISPDNAIPLVHSFAVSGAVRYDSYSDFGHNWAPMVGATLKPISWISLRARWNKAFQAPSLVQIAQGGTPRGQVNPGFIANFVPLLKNPAVPFNGGPIVSIQGSISPLQPQRARDFNLGFDISPPIVPGLDLHFTYFNINYTGSISTPPLGFGRFYEIPTFQNLYIMLPTIAQIQTMMTNAGVSASDIANVVASVNGQGGNAYVIADTRARNLGVSKVNGYDFGFNYQHETGFGSVDGSFSASYTNFSTNAADGVSFLPNQAGIDGARFNFVARAGADIGQNIRAQLTWNHLAGYTFSTPAQLGQTSIGAFNTLDLFLKYDMNRSGLPPIAWTLGINNLLNTAPPLYRGATSSTLGGYANGSTVGRLVQLGASVKF